MTDTVELKFAHAEQLQAIQNAVHAIGRNYDGESLQFSALLLAWEAIRVAWYVVMQGTDDGKLANTRTQLDQMANDLVRCGARYHDVDLLVETKVNHALRELESAAHCLADDNEPRWRLGDKTPMQRALREVLNDLGPAVQRADRLLADARRREEEANAE